MINPAAGYLLVALGGAGGAMARMAVGNWVRSFGGAGFPWHTFVINITGSLLLGFVATLVGTRASASTSAINHLVAIGFLGAYTTFSTFELETWTLVNQGRWLTALGYVLGSVTVGFAGLGVGIVLGRLI